MASEISETQREILATAAQRKSGLVLPVQSRLKGGALKKVLSALLTRGAIEEVPADGEQEIWRTNDGGVALTLKLTKAGRAAVGRELMVRAKDRAVPNQSTVARGRLLNQTSTTLIRRTLTERKRFAGEPMKPADIAPEARMRPGNVRQLLRSMVRAGQVKKVADSLDDRAEGFTRAKLVARGQENRFIAHAPRRFRKRRHHRAVGHSQPEEFTLAREGPSPLHSAAQRC